MACDRPKLLTDIMSAADLKALQERLAAAPAGREKSSWWRRYRDHLASPKWAELRRQVLERAHHTCEKCGCRPASQIHHKSYKNLGRESPEELAVLCPACHQARHPHRDLGGRRAA